MYTHKTYLDVISQMTTRHASAEASMATQAGEINELKRQLDNSTSEQSRLTEMNVQQQANIDGLQQQLMQMKAEHESTENQLTDSKTLMSQLQASIVSVVVSCILLVHVLKY